MKRSTLIAALLALGLAACGDKPADKPKAAAPAPAIAPVPAAAPAPAPVPAPTPDAKDEKKDAAPATTGSTPAIPSSSTEDASKAATKK